MPYYYLYLIANPTLGRPELVNLLKSTASIVVERGGVVRLVENLGIRHLAYVMKRHQMVASVGRYIRLQVDCNPQTLLHLDHSVRTNELVLRWSFIKQKEGVAAMKEREMHMKMPTTLKKAIKISERLGLGIVFRFMYDMISLVGNVACRSISG